MAIYKNITTSTTTDLITRSSKSSTTQSGNISKITICNTDSLPAQNISVFLEDAAVSTSTHANNNKFYFIYYVDLPTSSTLVLSDNLSFDKSVFSLRIITNNDSGGGTPSLSIIIK